MQNDGLSFQNRLGLYARNVDPTIGVEKDPYHFADGRCSFALYLLKA